MSAVARPRDDDAPRPAMPQPAMPQPAMLDPVEASEALRDHGLRIGRLEAGQQGLMVKLAEISAEGRTRGEHQDRRADRDSQQTQQAIAGLRSEMRATIAETTAPLNEAQRTLIRQSEQIAGGIKVIRNMGIGIGGVVSALLGFQPFVDWIGHVLRLGGR
ncbi:hypothetical protein [Gluconacetobacter azotocaptans]|uniref:hypothetical protein n=1 Tax=Gluconacetobacter azotocaptans TaxID=142834 RepID=UPI001F0471BE|nr:hypothetical protein [Gluconacetobacter azotocaptans]